MGRDVSGTDNAGKAPDGGRESSRVIRGVAIRGGGELLERGGESILNFLNETTPQDRQKPASL
jgi:hypothetical protein